MANDTSLNVTAKGLNIDQKVDGNPYHIGPVLINPINVNVNGLYFPIPYTIWTISYSTF